MTEKLIKDGLVAVAVSGGYGAGWSTWNDVDPTDARFNVLFEKGDWEQAAALCEELEMGYTGGAEQVRLEWVLPGTPFVIDEYDGSESLVTKDDYNWRVA
jgi:hypothetical protein